MGTTGGYRCLGFSFPTPRTSHKAEVPPGGIWEEHLGWGRGTRGNVHAHCLVGSSSPHWVQFYPHLAGRDAEAQGSLRTCVVTCQDANQPLKPAFRTVSTLLICLGSVPHFPGAALPARCPVDSSAPCGDLAVGVARPGPCPPAAYSPSGDRDGDPCDCRRQGLLVDLDTCREEMQ